MRKFYISLTLLFFLIIAISFLTATFGAQQKNAPAEKGIKKVRLSIDDKFVKMGIKLTHKEVVVVGGKVVSSVKFLIIKRSHPRWL